MWESPGFPYINLTASLGLSGDMYKREIEIQRLGSEALLLWRHRYRMPESEAMDLNFISLSVWKTSRVFRMMTFCLEFLLPLHLIRGDDHFDEPAYPEEQRKMTKIENK